MISFEKNLTPKEDDVFEYLDHSLAEFSLSTLKDDYVVAMPCHIPLFSIDFLSLYVALHVAAECGVLLSVIKPNCSLQISVFSL